MTTPVRETTDRNSIEKDQTVHRGDADFSSQGTRCAAWLYRPAETENPPVVVMAHGFGGEREWGLPSFAEHFGARGMAVLLFDYRRFGDSDGKPRNLITPTGHVRDWLAAIGHVRTLDPVDSSRLALWGTSFSGGHVLAAAARDGNVDAVVLQAPFTDGLRTVLELNREGGGVEGYMKKAVCSALRDVSRKFTRRGPHYVPLVGDPDEFAVLNRPGTRAGFEQLSGGEWDNRCPGRILLSVLGYRPIKHAGNLDSPALVVQLEQDNIIPRSTIDELVNRLDEVERARYPFDHWEVYSGEPFEAIADRETGFLTKHLLE